MSFSGDWLPGYEAQLQPPIVPTPQEERAPVASGLLAVQTPLAVGIAPKFVEACATERQEKRARTAYDPQPFNFFGILPEKIRAEVFGFLSPEDQGQAARACRLFHETVQHLQEQRAQPAPENHSN